MLNLRSDRIGVELSRNLEQTLVGVHWEHSRIGRSFVSRKTHTETNRELAILISGSTPVVTGFHPTAEEQLVWCQSTQQF